MLNKLSSIKRRLPLLACGILVSLGLSSLANANGGGGRGGHGGGGGHIGRRGHTKGGGPIPRGAGAASREAGAPVAGTAGTLVEAIAEDSADMAVGSAATASDSALASGSVCISPRYRCTTRPIGGAAFPIITLMTPSTPGMDRRASTKQLTRRRRWSSRRNRRRSLS